MNFVRPSRAIPSGRAPRAAQAKQVSAPLVYSPPRLGLVLDLDVSSAQEGAAAILTNFIPTLTGARIRGGCVAKVILSGLRPVETAFTYKYGTTQVLFMATETGIFDTTAPPGPPTTVLPVVSGMGSGQWTAFQHTTSGSSYLVCFNGVDTPRRFDGTTWSTSLPITFSDSTTPDQICFGWLFKSREFLLKNASLDAYYLPVNNIGGAAALFPLGGVMKKGGALLTGFSWSIDSGDGPSNLCAFVSTEGEVAVYSGSDPSSATDFGLRQIYQIGRPLGKNAIFRSGGDVWVATTDGLLSMSQVVSGASVVDASVSRPIDAEWRALAELVGYGWQISEWRERNLMVVTLPTTELVTPPIFVMNTVTRKWAKIDNWSANCFASIQGGLFFGTDDGKVWQGDVTGEDDGQPFIATYLSHFLPAGQPGQQKSASLGSMTVKAKRKPKMKIFARADQDVSLPPSPRPSIGVNPLPGWDAGLWDEALWDGSLAGQPFSYRQNVRAFGYNLAIGCMITSAGPYELGVELDQAALQLQSGEAEA